jgi:hypothetical protein
MLSIIVRDISPKLSRKAGAATSGISTVKVTRVGYHPPCVRSMWANKTGREMPPARVSEEQTAGRMPVLLVRLGELGVEDDFLRRYFCFPNFMRS